ncbi:chromo domain-containing protein [Trichonephila inaurata madagascariensis]|uniref:Chromo domain-containing protein n=1 Tax=Trichonephila inaurata madagascariensis TaxID=2747483 RepID=A0A8X6X712_9ARAC|nr:chromo domain-containing protein [Trichonephila inaurata madagascariensis]
MFRFFAYRKSYKYNNVLQSLVKSYNDSKHRSIGMAPSKVTRKLEPQIFKKTIWLYYTIRNPQITLKEGDLVRISKANKPFRRGYLPGWSDEVITVEKVYPTTYKLQDLKVEAIKGRFYAEELEKMSKSSDDYIGM